MTAPDVIAMPIVDDASCVKCGARATRTNGTQLGCFRCFPGWSKIRWAQDRCRKCGWIVSGEPGKRDRREPRRGGGWDHVDGKCPPPTNDDVPVPARRDGGLTSYDPDVAARLQRDAVLAARRRGDVL